MSTTLVDGRVPPRPVAAALVGLVRVYQLVPKTGLPRCRFAPSCSAYAIDALRLHGALRGSWLAVRRLGRCHPWNPGGIDRVPRSLLSNASRHPNGSHRCGSASSVGAGACVVQHSPRSTESQEE